MGPNLRLIYKLGFIKEDEHIHNLLKAMDTVQKKKVQVTELGRERGCSAKRWHTCPAALGLILSIPPKISLDVPEIY